jgi:hypothetical protein
MSTLNQQPWAEEEVVAAESELRAALQHDRGAVEDELLPLLTAFVQKHVELWGFPYPCEEFDLEALQRALVKAARTSPETTLSARSRLGVDFLRKSFPSFWKACNGPVSLIHDAAKLRPIIAFRIGLNDVNEVYDFTPKTLRRGFISGRKTTSLFKPLVAAQIYEKYLPKDLPPRVWDPSAGFGARMLGFASLFPRGTYIFNEPATETMRDLKRLADLLKRSSPDLRILGSAMGSEVEGPSHSVGLVFTSPPYFDKEKYFTEPGQCWLEHPSEEEWTANYLNPTIQRAEQALEIGGFFVMNVDNERASAVVQAAAATGMAHVGTEHLELGSDHFLRTPERTHRAEPVLVFQKIQGRRVVSVLDTRGRYTVSDSGEITSYAQSAKGKLLSGATSAAGYQNVGLYVGDALQPVTMSVHRIVCQAYHGPAPSPLHVDVRHRNGDKQDNSASNLAWGTRSENMLDVVQHRKSDPAIRAEQSPGWYQGRTGDMGLVQVCVDLFNEGRLQLVDVARLLDCTEAVAANLMHGRTASSVLIGQKPAKPYRSPVRKAEIRALISQGKNRDEVNGLLQETLTHQEFYYYRQGSKKEV